jgi:hypothetical protein
VRFAIRLASAAILVIAAASAVAAPREGLGPPSRLVLDACRSVAARAAAQGAALTVYCPPLVPHARGIRLEWAGSLDGGDALAPGYLISFASRVAGGPSGWGGHWTLDVGRPAAVRRARRPFPQRPDELIAVAGRDVGVYWIPEDIRSFYAGHVVYAWQEHGLRFHLSVHGYQWEARLRRIASALMAAMDRCRARPALRFCSNVVMRPAQ